MSWPRSIGTIAGVLCVGLTLSAAAFAQYPPAAPGPGGPPRPGQPAPAPGQPAPGQAAPVQPAPAGPALAGPADLHPGRLAAGDLQLEGGKYYDEYTIQAAAGEEIIAIVTAIDFDPYLILIPPAGDAIENDDFAGSADVSLIEVPVDTAGAYRIRVTSYEAGEVGEYALMSATRPADGDDAGDGGDFTPETFTIKGPIQIGQAISGTLGEDDPVRDDGSFYEAYSLQGAPGMSVVITLQSKDFDSFLTVTSPSGVMEANDDQAEGDFNSRLELTLDEAGTWTIVANTLAAGETGNYTLLVARN
jgi:hypothetical protein